MKRKLLIAVGVLLGVLLGGGLLVLLVAGLMIDSIVRAAVEEGSTRALGVPVTLDSAEVKFSGSLALEGLTIGNPEGFQEPHACAFQRFDGSVRPGSLMEDVVEVPELRVIKPEMTVEFIGTKNNWTALLDNLSLDREKKETDKKFRIDVIRVESATVRFRSDILTDGAKVLTLPTIELRNVGTAEDAATMTEVLKMLMNAMLEAALKSSSGMLPSRLTDSLDKGISSAREKVEGIIDSGIEKVNKPLEGLFKKK